MGNVTLLYPCGNQVVNRGYIVGFACPFTIFNTTLIGDVFQFEGPSPGELWQLRVSDQFFPPTTNSYSMDFVFDAADCWHYFSGVPSPAFLHVGLGRVVNESEYRIFVSCTAPADPAEIADLVQPPVVWRALGFYS